MFEMAFWYSSFVNAQNAFFYLKMGICGRKQGDFVKKYEKYHDFLKFFLKKFAGLKKRQYLCTRFRKNTSESGKRKSSLKDLHNVEKSSTRSKSQRFL